MKLDPAPQINQFGWEWQRWLSNQREYVGFDGTRETITTTAANIGDNHIVLVDDDTAGGAVTLTLPLAANFERTLQIKKLGTTGSVIVDGNGSETIDNSANYTITTQYESITIISNGTGWFII